MGFVEKVALGVKHPQLLVREANRVFYRMQNRRGYNEEGCNVMAEDWDNLVLLDGCRNDLFVENCDIDGRLETRISRGSATREFLAGNFDGRAFHDTVYVTANPQFYRRNIDCEFHAVENVWKDEGWDEQEGTVLPETVTERAIAAQERYPNKRLLIHYMQPHFPFIGSDVDPNKEFMKTESGFHIWMELQTGKLDVDRDAVWSAYDNNLRHAFLYVRKTLETLEGKSVVTSDHGNLFGERIKPFPVRTWGHPRQLYVEPLVRVPWLVVDSDSRPDIVSEAPQNIDSSVEDDVVASRLEDLGYIE